jgi:porin
VGDGNKINDAVGGSLAPISTLDAQDFTQLTAYYFEQSLCDGKCRFKFGKQDANSEFANSMITGEFVNGGISPPPNIPVPTFPDPGLGILGEVIPLDWLTLRTALYGAELDGRKNGDGGLFSGDLVALFEVDFTTTNVNRYGGTYRFGAWMSTLETDEIVASTNNNPGQFGDNYGFYVLVDQPLYLEPSAKDASGQGLVMFFEYSWTPQDRNQINQFFSTGAMYTGLIPTRDSDEIGFGMTYIMPSDRLDADGLGRGQSNFELFYKANITPWLFIQPDLQWLTNVGGAALDAVVVGARIGISG